MHSFTLNVVTKALEAGDRRSLGYGFDIKLVSPDYTNGSTQEPIGKICAHGSNADGDVRFDGQLMKDQIVNVTPISDSFKGKGRPPKVLEGKSVLVVAVNDNLSINSDKERLFQRRCLYCLEISTQKDGDKSLKGQVCPGCSTLTCENCIDNARKHCTSKTCPVCKQEVV